MGKKLILAISILFISIVIFGQTDFEKYQQQQSSEQQKFIEAESKAQANYYKQQDSLFIQYKEQIEKLWNEFIESTPKEWVSYNSDFSGRSKVNFEKNKIKIEAVVEAPQKVTDDKVEESKAKDALKKQIVSILNEKDEITNEPILKNQVATTNNKVIKQNEIEKTVEDLVKKSKKITFKNKEGKKMIKYEINLNLIPNNIKIRLEKYKPTIEKFCKKYDIDISLVLAIIHTESFFNPKAYNRHGNAYGMMQIVPKYAGLTMNNYIFKKNKKPNSRQLFNSEINLEMGIGYMRWLADNKWSKVTNKTNRQYCIICSYNGGPGTIYKAMTGKMKNIGDKWEPMFEDLDKMNSQKLYRKLCRDVPYEETRNYIRLVTEKMNKYYKK
jgi:membrane-bound lytic murein transglycosylase C